MTTDYYLGIATIIGLELIMALGLFLWLYFSLKKEPDHNEENY